MCGIFGYIGKKEAAPIIVQGLKRLEYRGYDSAGIAVLNGNPAVHCVKKKGKVKELESKLKEQVVHGSLGLGHTRWATHGEPSDPNSHPHLSDSGKIAIVHNGIIENYNTIKAELIKDGYVFNSHTDSEVFAHLIAKNYKAKGSLVDAVIASVKEVDGSYALGVIHKDEPNRIIATRVDSPLVVGLGKDENFIASDLSAIVEHTKEAIMLKNKQIAVINENSVEVLDEKGVSTTFESKHIEWDIADAEKQGYPHFMLKEIFEQPAILESLIHKRLKGSDVEFEELQIGPERLKGIKHITLVACGTSYHACMVGQNVIERLTPLRVSVDTSSEFRYKDPKVDDETLVMVVSQSGETADTLAALREAKKKGALSIAICNVLGSSIEREADGIIYTHAGPEIAVASTKAYTAQLAVFYLWAIYLSGQIFQYSSDSFKLANIIDELKTISEKMDQFLHNYQNDQHNWEKNVHRFNVRYHEQLEKYFKTDPEKRKRSPNGFFLYLGRNINFPSALEGALKLKEISYISAEGYAAGEMKHGPIALIDENPWVICIAVHSATYDKMVSNLEEIKARGGMITAIVTEGDETIKNMKLFRYIEIPKVSEIFSPMLVALPLQLIAYTVAKEFKEEIDQPRNLAKSVTVE